MLRYESFIEVDAPVESVFDMLADFESYPFWMSGVRRVRRTGPRTTHWVAETALDVDVEWEAETTVFNPDRRIVWRAFRGDIHADGEAILAQTERRTTVVHYVLGYDTPAGRSGERAAHFFGEHPLSRLERDLARFKRLAEGAARAPADMSLAPRGEDEERARRHYAGRHAEDERDRDARRRNHGGGEDRGGWGYEEIQRRAHHEAGEHGQSRDRERTLRERDDRQDARTKDDRRDGRVRDNRRDGREREMRSVAAAPWQGEEGREGERAREEQRGYEPGWFERRGVDHLLDEPPSRRWRR
jgi:uncharacterized membrane protein